MDEEVTETKNILTPAQVAHKAADIILDKKGEDLVVLDISGTATNLADYMVIGTGTNRRQVQAMAEAINLDMKAAGVRRLSVTGKEFGWWVLLDLGDVVVHVMQDDARRYYDIETLWADAPVVRRVDGGEASPPTPADPDALPA
ncbi:MAG: ribosome silencing factor [Planctomycetes bacterium]|nr:ribosome silencing factor [Planctomycetota bacterium]